VATPGTDPRTAREMKPQIMTQLAAWFEASATDQIDRLEL